MVVGKSGLQEIGVVMWNLLRFLWIVLLLVFLAGTADVGAMGPPVRRVAKEISGEAVESGLKQAGKRCVGGSSSVLARRLGIDVGSGFHAHHIIPVELQYHRTLNKIGFDLDVAENGIALPSRPGLHPRLPVHRGYHAGYSKSVRRELDSIPEWLSEEVTRERVYAIIGKNRKLLEEGAPLYESGGVPNAWR